ncbi:MAG: hypothetical protein HYR85_15755 [Planctomycetes bacterium]|nr:hypothetical protein [Planctomycetota bacterium]MBI3848114.1 hypothetical protein [Planctomycetota bacterium]
MAEVFQEFDESLVAPAGQAYHPRACGCEVENGLWEGWIEFVPATGPVLRTPRETTQPNRTDLAYWATGLSLVYLEGALGRALTPEATTPPAQRPPAYGRAAPSPSHAPVASTVAILDPFSVIREGEDVLRHELMALQAWHLRNIVRAYRLADERTGDLETLAQAPLVDLIVTATREIVAQKPIR